MNNDHLAAKYLRSLAERQRAHVEHYYSPGHAESKLVHEQVALALESAARDIETGTHVPDDDDGW